MENQKLKQTAEEIIKKEIRKGELIKSKDVLAMLLDVIDTVQIDCKKMRSSIEKCLYTTNPFNSFLSAFGVQLINTDKALNRLLNSQYEQGDVSIKIDNSRIKKWLMINSNEFKDVVEKISKELHELEIKADTACDKEKKRYDDLFSKHTMLKKEYDELKYNTNVNEKQIAKRIQRLLSLGGKSADSENEELIELLGDLDINVYWDCKDAPMTDAAMFTEYIIDDESMLNIIMPCLIRNGSVYEKGIRYKAPSENLS